MKYKLSSDPKQHKYFIKLLQKRIASTSVGPSTARGMGKKGLIGCARKYLEELDINQLSKIKTEKDFKEYLDKNTEELAKKLKRYIKNKGNAWGPARKFLNIFLRGIIYNRFICYEYNLFCLEKYLEVPLDSYVISSLRQENKNRNEKLPRWSGVIHLTKENNEKYQNFAKKIAKVYKTYRVHLDLLYWRKDK